MKKQSLTAEQLKKADDLDKTLKDLTNIRNQLKDYKLGDIYILESWDKLSLQGIFVEETNMGFPAKYKVVYISNEGVPYLRKITSAGNPTGEAWLPFEAVALRTLNDGSRHLSDPNWGQRFVPDPEQMDAILLQEEFDPMAQHSDKSKLFNEINKHNKAVAVSTGWYDYNKIAAFFKTLTFGDVFWTSPDKQYVILSIAKVKNQYVISCTDMNQTTVNFTFNHFLGGRRLYRARPRSFAKESAQ